MAYKIKVKYRDELRVVMTFESKPLVRDFLYAQLEEKIRSRFDLPAERQIRVTFKDEDNDVITVANDLDLVDALSIQPLGPLRLDVTLVEPKSMALDVVLAAAATTQGDNLEGAPRSKKRKQTRNEELVAEEEYFTNLLAEKLLVEEEYLTNLLAPLDNLPETPDQLEEVLTQTPVKLPVSRQVFERVHSHKLLTHERSNEVQNFASLVESALRMMDKKPVIVNEATSSAYLFQISGHFIHMLNDIAPHGRKLLNVSIALDSSNPKSTQTASQPLERLARPDFQLYVKGCLMLRWENKLQYDDFPEAVEENSNKLKAWSPLFYGSLPYVIGGCCAGNMFRWLRLRPDEKGNIYHDFISPFYDLSHLMGVVEFLHSNVRMHCLLQKLQECLNDEIKVRLYRPMARGNNVTVTIYPHFVRKEIREDDVGMRPSLYTAIKHSKYLIHGAVQRRKKTTVVQLTPVGDPHSEPVTLKEFEDATHDILCGLHDLHEAGYTHRDIRWENCIKVNIKGQWKWVLIDLEAAGADGEEWTHSILKGWDRNTLEGTEKKYTKTSDFYQLGKLLCQWLYSKSPMDEVRHLVMKSRAEKMMDKASPAATVKELFCKSSCTRCRFFGIDS